MRIVLADDHALLRDGLKILLGTRPGYQVVAEFAELTSLREQLPALAADLLILDYHMPGGDAGALLQWSKQRYPELKIIALTGAQSALIFQQLHAAGADALLAKAESGAEILQAIDWVMRGKSMVSASILHALQQSPLDLSPREAQILKLIRDGLSSTAIAEQLGVAPKTVDKHRENLMRKLEVSNVVQLLNKVHALKLLDD